MKLLKCDHSHSDDLHSLCEKPRDFTRLTQHFFFFTKRKPVLKEKDKYSFGKAFLFKKRFVELCVIWWSVDMEVASRIAFAATPSIRGNPTAEHAGGNACVVSSQDNVGTLRTQLRSTVRTRTLRRV